MGLISLLRDWYSRRSLWARRLFVLLLALSVSGALLWFTPTGYYITAPGAAVDTGRMVAVKGGKQHDGKLYMLIVAVQPANLFWYLYAQLDNRAVLETPREFLGTIPNYEEYVAITRKMMSDSQNTAKAIAMQLAGYGQGVRSAGARVVYLAEGAPAAGHLQKDDVLVEVAGRKIEGAEEFRELAKSIAPGVTVPMRVRRGGSETMVSVPAGSHPDPARQGSGYFGVSIADELTFDIPVQVDIKSGAITGPSAGLMFTLQIIDQLTPGGITGGRIIAGTGTIERGGQVGNIGGVQQKVFTAETAGAEVMFVPRGNYEDAKKVATRIEVVPVDNVRDALEWLRQHSAKKAGHSSPAFCAH